MGSTYQPWPAALVSRVMLADAPSPVVWPTAVPGKSVNEYLGSW